MAESPASNRSLPSPVAPASDRPRVSTRAAAGTDASRSAMRRFGSLASTFAKKIVGDAGQTYRDNRLQDIKSKEMEVAAVNVLRVNESIDLQDKQNDILAKIIAELKGLNLGSDGQGGELPDLGDRGRIRPSGPRGQRGRFGARGRERLQRMQNSRRARRVQAMRRQISRGTQAARRIFRETVTRTRPATQPRPLRVEPSLRAPTQDIPRQPAVTPDAPRARVPETPRPEAPRPSSSPAPRPSAQQLRADIRSRIPAAARRAAASSARRIIPGLAIALAVIPILNRLRMGDFAGAGIEFGAALVGSLPVVGVGAGAAAATVNESRDVYRELLGVYPEDDSENPERSEIFRDIVIQVASYISEAAEEQAREARERVVTREAGPAGAAAEFYADQPAPSQLGVQADEETPAERGVRENSLAQERRVDAARQETAEIQRLWPEITQATRDITDETLLRDLPRGLSGTARRAERELWLRRRRYQLYLERTRGQRPEGTPSTDLATPLSSRSTGLIDLQSTLQLISGAEFNSIELEAEKILFDGEIKRRRQSTGGQYTTRVAAPPAAAIPDATELTPPATPAPAPTASGTSGSSSVSRPAPGGSGVVSRIGRAIFGGSSSSTPSTGGVTPPSSQQTAAAPATPSLGVSGGGVGASAGAIAEVVERGPGFNVVKYDDGRVERRTGSRNWRNNNPGNIEFGDFARRQGAIGTDGRFAIFPTYEAGRRAKEALLFEGRNYSGLTIAQAITRYAPPSENDTAMYIRVAAAAAGVSPSTLMRDLNSGQRQALLAAMERVEGFRVGNVQVIQQGTAVASAEQARPGPGPALAAEGAQMAAADQAQTRGQGQEVVVQVPSASPQQRIAAADQQAPSGRGEVSLNRRLEKQVA